MLRGPVAALVLTGCSVAGGQSGPAGNAAADTALDAMAVVENVTGDMGPGWAYVSPDLRFDSHSAATALPHPPALADATFGYFGDATMTRQYSPRQLATMQADHAGFALSRDLDGDGVAETYRTGFWRIGEAGTADAREGTFLAVFDRGRPPQVVDSTDPDGASGVFLSGSGEKLVVADCNCPTDGAVTYRDKHLMVRWSRADR